ncbi:hypothetical protein DFH28DRAFT_1177417 [Melampsora americana]|nr:hypothetical protein DFH28DRAFT_1177417 [Melampsora americana]
MSFTVTDIICVCSAMRLRPGKYDVGIKVLAASVVCNPEDYARLGRSTALTDEDWDFFLELLDGNPGLYLDEYRHAVYRRTGSWISLNTITHDLKIRLNLTLKKSRTVHPNQSASKCAQYYYSAHTPQRRCRRQNIAPTSKWALYYSAYISFGEYGRYCMIYSAHIAIWALDDGAHMGPSLLSNQTNINQLDNNNIRLILNLLNQTNSNNQSNNSFNHMNESYQNQNSFSHSNHFSNPMNNSSYNQQQYQNQNRNQNQFHNYNQDTFIPNQNTMNSIQQNKYNYVNDLNQSTLISNQQNNKSIIQNSNQNTSNSNHQINQIDNNEDQDEEMEVDSLLDADGSTDPDLDSVENTYLEKKYMIQDPYNDKEKVLDLEDDEQFIQNFERNVKMVQELPRGKGEINLTDKPDITVLCSGFDADWPIIANVESLALDLKDPRWGKRFVSEQVARQYLYCVGLNGGYGISVTSSKKIATSQNTYLHCHQGCPRTSNSTQRSSTSKKTGCRWKAVLKLNYNDGFWRIEQVKDSNAEVKRYLDHTCHNHSAFQSPDEFAIYRRLSSINEMITINLPRTSIKP